MSSYVIYAAGSIIQYNHWESCLIATGGQHVNLLAILSLRYLRSQSYQHFYWPMVVDEALHLNDIGNLKTKKKRSFLLKKRNNYVVSKDSVILKIRSFENWKRMKSILFADHYMILVKTKWISYNKKLTQWILGLKITFMAMKVLQYPQRRNM